MARREATLLLVCIVITLAVVEPIAVEWDSSEDFWNNPIADGGRVLLRCIGTDMDQSDTVSIVKEVITDNGPVQVQIVTNIEVLSPYSGLLNSTNQQRYTASHEIIPAENKHDLNLTIAGATGDDGGTFICTTNGAERTSTEKTLIVQEPMTEFYASYLEAGGTERRLTDGETVQWMAGTNEAVGCSAFVDGSVDTPIIGITIGGTDVTHTFGDITEIDDATEDANTANLYHFTMLKKQFSNTAPEASYNGQQMVCSGYTNGFENEVHTASVQLVVETVPNVMCEENAYTPVLGMSLEMTCTVQANPAATISLVQYNNATMDQSSTVITASTTLSGLDVVMQENGDLTTITLTIATVDETTLQQTYEIEAVNSYGSHTDIIHMQGDGSPTGTAAITLGSQFYILIAAVFATFLTSVTR